MKTKNELKVNYIATINVCGKPMQLSFSDTEEGMKFYLHFPKRKVTVTNEISRNLCKSLYYLKSNGTNN